MVEASAKEENEEVPPPEPAPETAPPPAPAESETNLQVGDLVHVPGFGWVPYQGPNVQLDGSDIYENGNKIGIM